MDAAIFHLENFANTWTGWYNVLKSLVTLVSQDFLTWIEEMVKVFQRTPEETKELLSSTDAVKKNEDGDKYVIDGSSFKLPMLSSDK